MGLGMLAGQLADLKLGELLDTPPPGLDEAVAIAKARLPVLSRMAWAMRVLVHGLEALADRCACVLCKGAA